MRLGLALLLSACVTAPAPVLPQAEPRPVVPAPIVEDPQAAVRSVVQAFLAAAEARQFEQARGLLSKPLRERYSVERLERDFGADPLAADRLAQIKLKASAPLVQAKEAASLEWSAGRSLRLVREADGWRIAALE